MKISLNWVGDFVDLSGVDPEKIVDLLSLHTAEVEGLEIFGDAIADVRVGHVVECGRHPDADKLSVTKVDFGAGEAVQVVCGAPNVRQGQKVAFAPVGSNLPGGLKLKKAKLRGQASHGMICSERELEFSDEHSGILELAEEAPIGTPLVEFLQLRDAVVELDNKSLTHRPDLWGHYGFARELAAILGRELKPLPVVDEWPGEVCQVPITLADEESCPLYLGLPVDLGGKPRIAPYSIRRRLLAVGQRPISDVVDLTNYVLLEIGQPTHAFDMQRLGGPAITVRRAAAGEKMTTLDGSERTLTDDDLLITDSNGPVALAGVMGGQTTEVDAETTQILLESAWFAPARIRRTSQRLALRSEASARFEKTLDPAIADQALRRFAFLLNEVRPEAKILAAPTQSGSAMAPEISLELDPVRTAELLGLELDRAGVVDPLRALGFGVEDRNGLLGITVPSWRSGKDITLPIDLVEEVGRLKGYDQVQPRELHGPIQPPWVDPIRRLSRRLGDRMAHAHCAFETQGYSFIQDHWPERLGLPVEAFLTLHNPVQADVNLIRRDPIASLLEQAVENLADREAGTLFEIGKGYEPRDKGLPQERKWLAAISWAAEDRNQEGPDGLFGAVRSVFADLLRTAGVSQPAEALPEVERAAAPWCHPARGLTWRLGDTILGLSGLVDPRLTQVVGGRRCVMAAVLMDLEAVCALSARDARHFAHPGRFPGIKVDVALALPDEVPYSQVEAALVKVGGKILDSLALFDVYRGGSLGEGRRSLAFHAVLRAADRTLTDKDERKFLDRVEKAATELGGKLRS